MAFVDHVCQSVSVDGDTFTLQRHQDCRSGGLGVQTADCTPFGPVPERRVHRIQVGSKARGAGQHEKKGQVSSNLLTGVQERVSDPLIQRVGLVKQQDERFLPRARLQCVVQRRRVTLNRAPSDTTDGKPPPSGVRRCVQEAGNRRSTSLGSFGMSAGVRRSTSTLGYLAASRCSQTSNAVLPLPRGPWSTISRGGARARLASRREKPGRALARMSVPPDTAVTRQDPVETAPVCSSSP